MMYFKLAMENVKNSFKDYIIYFITLILAVCVFYNFNSITSHSLIFKMNIYQKESIRSLSKIIYYLSIFIALIFCSLIVYANNALIKKRKKEFGIYGTLGMSKFKISQILIYETLVVGIISLILGLIIGIITSQGVSVFVAKVFNFDIGKYRFIISTDTLIKTILYFGIMFLLIMIFNVIVVSKNKLIDLIYASKKNEIITVRSSIISAIIFILSLVVLGTAYYMAWKYSITPKNIKLPYSVLLGGLGTLLFFFGFSGVMFFILKKNKNIYLKDLNIFVIKQFTNKINTNFISMALISLMMFLSIIILGVSVNVKYQLGKHLEISMPSDVKVTLTRMKNNRIPDINKTLDKLNFKLKDSYTKYKIDTYDSTTIYISASKKEKWLLEKDFMKLDKILEKSGFDMENSFGCYISAESKAQNYNQAQNSVGTILYMGLYLGFIFLIASSAMLSIQQLTEASDSINRYKSLKRVGVSDEMINSTIKSQILIHFIAPFSLAIVHTIAAIKILDRITNSEGTNMMLGFNLTLVIVMTGILIVYILYLYTTYILYKNMIKDK